MILLLTNISLPFTTRTTTPLQPELLDTILKNKEFDKLADTVFVYSDEEGFEQIEQGAAAYIHLPADMQKTIAKDEPVVIKYAGNPALPLEDALLTGCYGSRNPT